ncbi:MAG: hypothetical protein NTU41_15285 [Chloroflexi bacterium]|nr:hypothetical protein [Chloroflexota bacterium]
MRPRIVLLATLFVLAALAVCCCYLAPLGGTAEAASPVSPSVTVGPGVTLALEDASNVQWVSGGAPGSSLNGTLQARVSSNVGWSLTVQATSGHTSTNELTDESHRIASACFTYTSTAGTPAPPTGDGVSNPKEFDGGNQTNVWTGGTATADCRVAVTYNLQIPKSQPPGTYTATHTYTVAPS